MTMADGRVWSVDAAIELRRDLSEVASARSFVRRTLADAAPSLMADAALVVSELVTNAVEHGSGEPIGVGVGRRDGSVVLCVTSAGPAGDLPPPGHWAPASPNSASGRGLGIVASIATDVGVEIADDRVTTTVVLGS